MNSPKWKIIWVLIILFSNPSCSWFKNLGADNYRKPAIGFNAVSTTTPEIPVYQQFECVPFPEEPETGLVVEVIDGDSIKAKIGDKVYEIRYIGIDTPEYHSNKQEDAERATLENRRLVEGKTIYLLKDRSNTDKYHRLLRFVFTNELFVNFEMVRRGKAEPKSYYPDTSCQELFNLAVP